MSWLFSQALVEAYSAENCSDGEPSARLNVMPTPHKFSRNDKTMESSSLSRFGLTCAVLTADRGEALLTWYREGFLARTSALQEREQESQESAADFGAKCLGSFAKVGPRFVFVENSPALTSRGLHAVLGDLAEMGFDARWGVLGAIDAAYADRNAAVVHDRYRIWIRAESIDRNMPRQRSNCRAVRKSKKRNNARRFCEASTKTNSAGIRQLSGRGLGEGRAKEQAQLVVNGTSRWWTTEPQLGRVVNGLAHRVDRLKVIGNGQVPQVAAMALADARINPPPAFGARLRRDRNQKPAPAASVGKSGARIIYMTIHESTKCWEQSRKLTEDWLLRYAEALTQAIKDNNVHDANHYVHRIAHYLSRYEQDIQNVLEAQKRDRLADAYKDFS